MGKQTKRQSYKRRNPKDYKERKTQKENTKTQRETQKTQKNTKEKHTKKIKYFNNKRYSSSFNNSTNSDHLNSKVLKPLSLNY